MREFTDADGRSWIAKVEATDGVDYKGRFYFVMAPEDDPERVLALTDIRWNSERTASRTLSTMSVVELRRRLRSAVGRGTASVS